MALEDVTREITDALRKVPGLTYVPDSPPSQINEWPAGIVYPLSGTIGLSTFSGGDLGNITSEATHTIRVLVVRPFKDISDDVVALKPFVSLVYRRLLAEYARDKFNGTVLYAGEPGARGAGWITYEMAQNDWGSATIGIRFSIVLTIEEEVIL